MQCPQCGKDNPDGAAACGGCGTPLERAHSLSGFVTPRGKRESLTWKIMLVYAGWLVIFLLAILVDKSTNDDSLSKLLLEGGGILCFATLVAFVIDCYRQLIGKKEAMATGCVSLIFWGGLTAALFITVILFNPFLNETRRSLVARVRGDQRSITIAIETYFLDHNNYPAWSLGRSQNAFGGLHDQKNALVKIPTFTMRNGTNLATLTTPVAYLSSYFTDPHAPNTEATFAYWTDATRDTTATRYIIWSPGPDGVYDLTIDNIDKAYQPKSIEPSAFLIEHRYDPSNGSLSGGDVWRVKQ